MEWIAFFCAVRHEHYDYLENTLQEYDIGLYLMAAEVTPLAHQATDGQHFHFLVQMNDTDYHKFAKRVFSDKFKLAGRAGNGKARQYGRVKKIEDLERLAAYTVKDGNIRSNMSEEQLKTYKEQAFTLEEKKDFRDKLMQHLIVAVKDLVEYKKEQFLAHGYCQSKDRADYIKWRPVEVYAMIIKYYRNLEDKLPVTPAQIESHVRYFMMYCDQTYTDTEIAHSWCKMAIW